MAQDQQHWSEPIRLLMEKLPKPPPSVEGGLPQPQESTFRVGALNVHSIKGEKRCGDVQQFIKAHSFDIFVVIESWLISTDDFPSMDGEEDFQHTFERKDRRYEKRATRKTKNTQPNSKRGGGILIYISDIDVIYEVKSRGEYAESNVEFLHIEITSPVRLHLVALYCPHKTRVEHLISLMSYFMDPLGDDRKNLMFIGDTNIDKYGVQPQDYLGNTFFDVLEERYEVNQLIDQITHDKACIDHIFTNMQALESGVMKNCITPGSGHRGIYCTLLSAERNPHPHPPPEPAVYRERTERDKVNKFMQKCRRHLNGDACILAIFYKFPKGVNAPAPRVGIICQTDEDLAYCKVFANEDDMHTNMDRVQKFVTQVEERKGQDALLALKQCIIFTRESRSPVFHALQKRMWYNDWDFVWQPRHVEFLGYVLEPSLTYAYPIRGGCDLHDKDIMKAERIRLQESTYRYCSVGYKSIEKL